MGVGGNFWELLKPYGRREGVDFLRDKKVAVDLSFWIVQQETALSRCRNPRALKPHLRLTFFRTINLFAKMGAFPVFVLDGEPSPLKARARIERFCRATGLDVPACSGNEDGTVVKRNKAFTGFVDECVELFEHLGMPVLRARSEAEALCAQLNIEGYVDACITADSDALLFGAQCVIKCIHPNSREPFECYYISDIEAGLGLKRKQLIAISLLVGNDHNLNGVPGIGIDTAVQFVQLFTEDEILERLCGIGKGCPFSQISMGYPLNIRSTPDMGSSQRRTLHCTNCGHPGSRKDHVKTACETCLAHGNANCITKPRGFKCRCPSCDEELRNKELKRHESWRLKVCQKISDVQNFPNKDIIDMYLSNKNGHYHEKDGPLLLWENPSVDALVDFLVYHLHWEPSYIRQRILPMLTTIFLRETAKQPVDAPLLMGQYEFHSIHRLKIRCGYTFYMVKWKRVTPSMALDEGNSSKQPIIDDDNEVCEIDDLGNDDLLDAEDVPEILDDPGGCFLVTDENIRLVQAAFPEEVDRFTREKELKVQNSKRRKVGEGEQSCETPKSKVTQLNITQFYRSTKTSAQVKLEKEKRKSVSRDLQKSDTEKNFSKAVRRRLLFD